MKPFSNTSFAGDSIQSAEYLEGARPDEPNFVAIWQLLVLDTQPHSVLEPGLRDGGERPEVKLIVLVKRKPGSTRAEFRARSLDTHADLALQLPGLRGYQQNHARDGHYAVGGAQPPEVMLQVLDRCWQERGPQLEVLATSDDAGICGPDGCEI